MHKTRSFRFATLVLGLSLWIACGTLYAQEYNFVNFNVAEGLAQSQVRDILQDSRGFLWIATKGSGVSQFDGRRFRNAGRYDGLAANEMFDILEDSQGRVWCTHPNGVTLYDGYNFRIMGGSQGLKISRESHVAEGKNGDIWVAGIIDGLFRFRKDKFEKVVIPDEIPADTILDVIGLPNGEICAITNRILFWSDGDSFKKITDLPASIEAGKFAILSDGRKVLVGIGPSIYELDLSTGDGFIEKLVIPEAGNILSLLNDNRNRLWVGGDNGLARIEDGELLVFDNKFTAWSMGVTVIRQDFDGNIWIGTDLGGLFKFSGELFAHFGNKTLLENSAVFAVTEIDDGVLWAGSDKGLFELKENELRKLPIEGFPSVFINHLLGINPNKIYVAAKEGGFLYADGKFTPIRTEDGQLIKWVNYFSRDQMGNIWMGTMSGVYLVDEATATIIPAERDWKSSDITAVEEDSRGDRWYLLRGDGVHRYSKGKWSRLKILEGETESNALRLVEDRYGSMWFATYDGLVRYRDGEECSITAQDGLLGNTAYLLLDDKDGNLWVGTEKGINKIVLDKNSDPLNIKSYSRREGFKGVETNRGAGVCDVDGNLWFGTIEGLTRYNPEEDNLTPKPPKLMLSGAQVQLKTIDWLKRSDSVAPWNLLPAELRLRSEESDLRIDFIGVSMTDPEKIRYKYRLLPDTMWSRLTSATYASFSNLGYGSYTFEVQAININGSAESNIASIDIYIPTPITNTIWFQLALLASIFIMVYVLVRGRLNSSNRAKELLEVTVRERTEDLNNANRIKSDFLAKMSHEIRTPMNGVIGMTDLLRRTNLNERQGKFVENIRVSGQNLLSLINDILDFSRIESGKLELESTPLELRLLIEEVLDILAFGAYSKGLELLYWVDHEIRGPVFGDPARLKQILVNLVGNAIKFSEKGQVVVMARLVERGEEMATLQISVKDSGIGIPSEKFDTLFDSFSQVDASTTRKYGGSGLGLAISYGLAVKMGGKMWVESEQDKGAEFFFTMEGGLSAPWKFLGKDHPAFELIGQKVALAIANKDALDIIQRYFEHWEIEALVYESLEAVTDALVEGKSMDFLIVDTRLFTEHHLKAANHFAETCAKHQVHYGLLCEPAIAIALEESTNEFGWLLSKPLKRDDLLNALLHRRVSPRSNLPLLENDPNLSIDVPIRILIAEDNPINMDVAQGMLSNLGYQPDAAENGLEVLKAIKTKTYDVVLMDVQMPEMDGLETTRHLVENYSREKRPLIVAMTANAMESDRQRCLEAGMDTFISKPFVMDELIELISNIHAGLHPMPVAYEKHRQEHLTKALVEPVIQEVVETPPEKPVQAVEVAEVKTEPAKASDESPVETGEVLTSLDMLNEVSNGDTNFIKGILEKLVIKLPEAIQELRDALEKEDWETIRATSHRTKSSAAYSGAADLKEKFRLLEHMAREQEDLDQVPTKLDELENYVSRVVKELYGHLERL